MLGVPIDGPEADGSVNTMNVLPPNSPATTPVCVPDAMAIVEAPAWGTAAVTAENSGSGMNVLAESVQIDGVPGEVGGVSVACVKSAMKIWSVYSSVASAMPVWQSSAAESNAEPPKLPTGPWTDML